jgi:hypothetical protein
MYNTFARNEIHVTLSEATAQTLVLMYEQGVQHAFAVIVDACRQLVMDVQIDDVSHLLTVDIQFYGQEFHYVVWGTRLDNRIDILMLIPNADFL